MLNITKIFQIIYSCFVKNAILYNTLKIVFSTTIHHVLPED